MLPVHLICIYLDNWWRKWRHCKFALMENFTTSSATSWSTVGLGGTEDKS